MIVLLQKDATVVRPASVGFSWINLFFGFMAPAFRYDWKWVGIQFAASLITCGISNLIFPFFDNKLYIKGLLKQGYIPRDIASKTILVTHGLIPDDTLTVLTEEEEEELKAAILKKDLEKQSILAKQGD